MEKMNKHSPTIKGNCSKDLTQVQRNNTMKTNGKIKKTHTKDIINTPNNVNNHTHNQKKNKNVKTIMKTFIYKK